MTRITGPDCAVMCNLINTHTHTHKHTHTVDSMRLTLKNPTLNLWQLLYCTVYCVRVSPGRCGCCYIDITLILIEKFRCILLQLAAGGSGAA